MESVQKEHGHSPIAHPILEAFALAGLSGGHFRVLMAVIRRTYGWSRRESEISYSEFQAATGLSRNSVTRVVTELVREGVLLRTESPTGTTAATYRLQKNSKKWGAFSPQTLPVSVHPGGVPADGVPADGVPADGVPATGDVSVPADGYPLQNKKTSMGDKSPNARGGRAEARAGAPAYTEAFESAWGKFPKRDGSNPKKSAYRSWNARLADGASTADLLKSVDGYAQHIRERGKEGSPFVMQASRFFGPDEPWREFLVRPEPKPRINEAWFEPRAWERSA